MASPLAAASRGSVQQGLYAAGGFLGFSKLGLAADKRYSLSGICPSSMNFKSAIVVGARRIVMRYRALFRVAAASHVSVGVLAGLKQMSVVARSGTAWLAAQPFVRAMPPFSVQHSLHQFRVGQPTWLALAATASDNRSVDRTHNGGQRARHSSKQSAPLWPVHVQR
jgi:hypothetical protein